MPTYAENTKVPVAKSRAEIESTLTRYGADQFLLGWENSTAASSAMIGFRLGGKQVKFLVPLPDKDDNEFRLTPSTRRERKPDDRYAAWEKACRQRWRAVALILKAKLEAIESGITTIEREFLADIVLPDGKSVGNWLLPQIEEAYATGKMPNLLPMPKNRRLTDGRNKD